MNTFKILVVSFVVGGLFSVKAYSEVVNFSSYGAYCPHKVKPGEHLAQIIRNYGTKDPFKYALLDRAKKMNPEVANINDIKVNTVIRVPVMVGGDALGIKNYCRKVNGLAPVTNVGTPIFVPQNIKVTETTQQVIQPVTQPVIEKSTVTNSEINKTIEQKIAQPEQIEPKIESQKIPQQVTSPEFESPSVPQVDPNMPSEAKILPVEKPTQVDEKKKTVYNRLKNWISRQVSSESK